MRWYDDGSWWAWLVMSLGMLAIWGLILWAALAVVRGGPRTSTPRTSPEEILRERFAAGEIDEQEYRERRDALGLSSDAPRASVG